MSDQKRLDLQYVNFSRAIRERIATRRTNITAVSMLTRAPKKSSAEADDPSKCKIIRTHLNGDVRTGMALKSFRKLQFVS
ncbi:hypothetical protein NECAME_18261 [Necator americanus]|uniref:Uncharacterized protein n=1 Tax=Necator americanus TaxID=51031 RepID=W2SYM1_NECAM|nr:hypothetical protein NECAME_18261 [Necator americanus]ETN73737.1 hypothetical protein NECAME_18261 [Necator americanus]